MPSPLFCPSTYAVSHPNCSGTCKPKCGDYALTHIHMGSQGTPCGVYVWHCCLYSNWGEPTKCTYLHINIRYNNPQLFVLQLRLIQYSTDSNTKILICQTRLICRVTLEDRCEGTVSGVVSAIYDQACCAEVMWPRESWWHVTWSDRHLISL